MTVTVEEIIASGSQSLRGGSISNTRRFMVHDDTNAMTAQQAMQQPDIPRRWEQHPRMPGLIATRYSITPNTNSKSTFDVTWEYEPGRIEPPEQDNEAEAGTIGEIFISGGVRSIWVDKWRIGANPPTTTGIPARTDIEGHSIDSSGVPMSVAIMQQDLQIEQTVTRAGLRLSTWRRMSNGRNATNFLGADIGTVVYIGATFDETDNNIFTVTHSFVWDEDLHLRQIVYRDPDGKPAVGDRTDPDYLNVATTVYWVQPYILLHDFNLFGYTL